MAGTIVASVAVAAATYTTVEGADERRQAKNAMNDQKDAQDKAAAQAQAQVDQNLANKNQLAESSAARSKALAGQGPQYAAGVLDQTPTSSTLGTANTSTPGVKTLLGS